MKSPEPNSSVEHSVVPSIPLPDAVDEGTRRVVKEVFYGEDFTASRAAEDWCGVRGISVGQMQAHAPRGLLYGDFLIAKWRNLNKTEIDQLDGLMTGDFRNGPVRIIMNERLR